MRGYMCSSLKYICPITPINRNSRNYGLKHVVFINDIYNFYGRSFKIRRFSTNTSKQDESQKHENDLKQFLYLQQQFAKNDDTSKSRDEESTGYALVSICIAMFGMAFASIPLYEYFCQQSGYLGTVKTVKTYKPPPKDLTDRCFEIDFVTHSHVNWEFRPAQKSVFVRPGETTLAFYTAKNLLDVPVIGVAAYHVIPDEAGLYFNKIQCFCFEEQLLNPGEEVDLPVLFFLDPDILKDKKLLGVEKITLSYIFFEANSEIPSEYKALFNHVTTND